MGIPHILKRILRISLLARTVNREPALFWANHGLRGSYVSCLRAHLNYFLIADDTPGMWKVVGNFFVQRAYSVRIGIGKGRALPVYFVDAVREGASR